MVGAAACTRPPPRLRRGSGSDGDGYLHAHVPSCRWRRPMGERGQRPDPGSQAHLGAGGGVRGEPREPVVPAGKEVLRHERRGEGPGPWRSTRSGRTGQDRAAGARPETRAHADRWAGVSPRAIPSTSGTETRLVVPQMLTVGHRGWGERCLLFSKPKSRPAQRHLSACHGLVAATARLALVGPDGIALSSRGRSPQGAGSPPALRLHAPCHSAV